MGRSSPTLRALLARHSTPAFRKLAAELFPDRPLEPIPPTDVDFFAHPAGFDLKDADA